MTKTDSTPTSPVTRKFKIITATNLLIIFFILALAIPIASAFAATTVGQNIHTGGNLTVDGGLTYSGMTAGSLLFSGTGGLVSQDNAGLFWNNTTKQLGIGTATPAANLDVVDPSIPADRFALTTSGDDTELYIQNGSGSAGIHIQPYGTGVGADHFWIGSDGDNTIKFRDDAAGIIPLTIQGVTGNVGIGTITPSSPLTVIAPGTWADYGVIAAQNPNRSASTTVNALDSLNVYQTYFGVGSPLSNDFGPRMGSTGFFNTQPIPFGITNGGLGLYQAANSGGIGFFNNRPRGIFDIGNFSVSTGVISLSGLPNNGDTVTITDALATSVTYTFTTNNVGTNVQIEADIPNTLFHLESKIRADLDMDAYVDGDGTYIMLGQKTAGVAGDVAITKTGANISVIGMSGGSDFTGMANLYIDSVTGKLITAHDISGKNLEVDGGIKYNTVTAKSVCNATTRGTTWFTQGGGGAKDSFEVCAKDAGNNYAWRTIY